MTPASFRERKKFVSVKDARVAYLQMGKGREEAAPLLFVHGIPSSSFLWRHVIEEIAPEYEAFAPDLMGLGDTEVPLEADFTMPAQAEMLQGFCESLGLKQIHLVIHDQGGAAGLIFATKWPERLASLTITNCVCYDNWPVPLVKNLIRIARIPGTQILAAPSALSRRLMTSRFGMAQTVYNRSALTPDVIDEYLRCIGETPERRARFRKFLLAGDPRYTMEIVPALRRLEVPTGIIWSEKDSFLPLKWARKLERDIPGAQFFRTLPFAGHFFQEEKPAEFAALLKEFLAQLPPASNGQISMPKSPTERFNKAIALFDAANSRDPRQDLEKSKPVPRELLYARRLSAWVDQLEPDASEVLRLAARCQHLRRWEIPRNSYPMGRAGYHRWRGALAQFHAEKAGGILKDVGYDGGTIARVQSLIKKENLRSDPETQTLEDAICLVFLENELADFSEKHEEEKLTGILQKTWAKMSERGRQVALGLNLPENAKALVKKALA